jgi:signal transduction histidine kinase
VTEDGQRLNELMDELIALARKDYSRRATVGSGEDVLDGIAVGLNMLAEEIQKQSENERELRRRAAHADRLVLLGQLAAGVAHEINNPAAFVLLNLKELDELLHKASTTTDTSTALAEARALVRDAGLGVERIAGVVRDLQTFARLDAPEPSDVALAEVVEEATRLVGRELGYRAQLVLDVAPDARVRGSHTKLCQVLTNLLLNAAQAIPEGAPKTHRVEVTVRDDAPDVVVRVRDTGVGMPEEVRAHIFEPFFTSKARGRGMGLGLTISQEIIRQHGGSLACESALGRGTTFEIRLPRAAQPPAKREERTLTPSPAPSGRRRILIVDDEPAITATFARVLARHCDVVTAASGHEAITVLSADERWDAIVCDLMMPEVDGVAVHAWLTQHRPALAQRFVCSSGGAFTGRCSAFLERFDGPVVHKPATRAEILAAIDRVASITPT